MQFLIDTDTETQAGLLLAAEVLMVYARGLQDAKPAHAPAPPIGKPAAPAPVVPLPPGNVPPAPIIHPPFHPDALPKEEDVPAGTNLDPAAVFGLNIRGEVRPLVPSAPVATAAAAPISVATVPAVSAAQTASPNEYDSAGLPWDGRVHSDTMKKNADGTWRFRRNLDESVKAAVMAELLAAKNAPAVPPSPVSIVAPPPPTTSVAPPPPPAVPMPPATNVGVPNAVNGGVVQTVTSFRDLMTKVNVALAGGKLTQPQLAEACKAAGVDSVTALAAQAMLVPSVDQYLNRWLAA